LQLSLLDYLGINDPKSFGRSFFRMYNSDRDAVFAANYKKHLYWYHAATKDITNCSYVNWQCSLLQPKTQSMINSIFNVDYEAVPDSAENTLFLRSFMEYNDILQIDKAATQKMHAPTLFYLHPNDTQQFEEHE